MCIRDRSKMTDSLQNFETVKSFGAEQHELDRFSESASKYQQQNTNTQASLSLLNIAQQLILNATLAACLIFAATKVKHGGLDMGQFVAVSVYIAQLFAPLSFLGTIYSTILTSFVDMENLSNVLAENVDVQDNPAAIDLPSFSPSLPAIEFRNVHFTYKRRGTGSGLRNISFTVPFNTTTAIVGATGAGKSTITRLLLRYYDVAAGQVLVAGSDVRSVSQKSLRQGIGVVPQDTSLFNDTIRYNIAYGSKDQTLCNNTQELRLVTEAASDAELLSFIQHELPKAWETQVGERGQQISGGEKQRVAIARVLLKDPPVAVLDEATSHLDSKTEMHIQESLERLGARRTMLVIAHRLSTIVHAEQILVLFHGEILERGSHEELLANGEWHESCYAALWNRQTREQEKMLKEANDESDTKSAEDVKTDNGVKV
eukprot:TRINITY_DN19408_c0_g1_i3.p1 TRINITY_DN19408_c0_g1~~TRINITY_DN19408_c0_g1_i3.p1  ORF type:complete len:430 (+),score=130.12 TRINITY_DN19408_c0_g1_i3:93-1382(+)